MWVKGLDACLNPNAMTGQLCDLGNGLLFPPRLPALTCKTRVVLVFMGLPSGSQENASGKTSEPGLAYTPRDERRHHRCMPSRGRCALAPPSGEVFQVQIRHLQQWAGSM